MTRRLKLATAAPAISRNFTTKLGRIENVDLVGLCTLDGAMGRNIADRFDVATVPRDVADMLDAVQPTYWISSRHRQPTGRLSKLSRAALPLSVKPPCIDEAEAMVALAETAGVPLIVHENFRFQPWYRQARKVLDGGKLGEVIRYRFACVRRRAGARGLSRPAALLPDDGTFLYTRLRSTLSTYSDFSWGGRRFMRISHGSTTL